MKAIEAGARTLEMVSRRTGAGKGPCGGFRCGPMIRRMLGEKVLACPVCEWAMSKDRAVWICPRCAAAP